MFLFCQLIRKQKPLDKILYQNDLEIRVIQCGVGLEGGGGGGGEGEQYFVKTQARIYHQFKLNPSQALCNSVPSEYFYKPPKFLWP